MWFVNAHVVDALTGDRLRHRAVETAADGTVAQVAAAAPPGLPDGDVVDVAGRWLLPGLISCHTHLSVVFPFSDTDEAENPAITAYRSATRASEALRAGITTIRCVHEQNRADLLLRDRGTARLVHRAAHPRRGPGDLHAGRPRPGRRLCVRHRRAGVLRGGAGRARRRAPTT